MAEWIRHQTSDLGIAGISFVDFPFVSKILRQIIHNFKLVPKRTKPPGQRPEKSFHVFFFHRKVLNQMHSSM